MIVPAGLAKEDVYHPVSRRHRYVTLLACVSASGDALTPLAITSSPISGTLWRRGLTQTEEAMIRHRSPASITEELFYEYISNVFIPYVLVVRNRPGFQNEMPVLLMDSAVPQTSDRVRKLSRENNILAITFPAHTTNLFQALDLVFFEVVKRLKASSVGEFDDDSIKAHITKLIQEYEQTAASSTIRGSFRKAGLEHDIMTRPFKLQVIEESLRANPGFQEICAPNVSIES
jgi:tRNA(Ser,Leu) C12 N-acetylase TAN1